MTKNLSGRGKIIISKNIVSKYNFISLEFFLAQLEMLEIDQIATQNSVIYNLSTKIRIQCSQIIFCWFITATFEFR